MNKIKSKLSEVLKLIEANNNLSSSVFGLEARTINREEAIKLLKDIIKKESK